MPIPANSKWPRPKSEDEWEDMVLDAMRIRWRDPNASRNGRRGQEQHGVDIFGSSTIGIVAAQAKNMEKLVESEAIKEIAKAEHFTPKLQEYFFVISGQRDAKFQLFIRNISKQRLAEKLFPVHVLFFDDVIHELSNDKNLVRKYWGQFFSDLANTISITAKGPLLDVDSTLDEIRELDQFKLMTEYFNNVSDPNIFLSISIEQAPDLLASSGSIDRFWRIAIGESHPENTVFFQRIAISVDGEEVRIWQAVDNSWLTIDEWNHFRELNNVLKRPHDY